ncbi:restriction endonuclease subunit S [Staphylococcus sp. EZ-P03]|uniref:restriction endonuclease subunit S n=1 Tax=Staphylococcus sp. EZ-P03 TaxID=2282739 RepID=UPI000DF7FC4B|nr:restriction endonuclease subunit S [Staphylococcus sp. EZ-P03]
MHNTQTKKNIPELRFPEFEGEWEGRKVKEEFKVISGSTPLRSKNEYFNENGIPWVKTMDLNNSEVNSVSERVSDIAVSELNLIVIPEGTVLIAMYGGFNQIGRTGLLTFQSTINQAISALLDINKKHNPYFFQNYFNYKVNKWRRYAASSRKDPNITKKDIENFNVIFPTLNEQQKIGTFFSKLDQQIELAEKKVSLLQEQKKGYMQKIFSQQLRFKGENGNNYPEWEEKKLGTIAQMYSGGTPDSKNSSYYTGDIPFIRSGEIGEKTTALFINDTALQNSAAKKVKVNDILYALYGATSGEVAISKIEGAINQAVLCIKTQENNVYLYNVLRNKKENIIRKYLQGGQGNLSASIIKQIEVKLPIISEQQKIGAFFSKLDQRIELAEQKVEQLKEQKRGLLQKMFV